MWRSPGNAFDVVKHKDASELTRLDAITIALTNVPSCLYQARGFSAVLEPTGYDFLLWIEQIQLGNPSFQSREPDSHTNAYHPVLPWLQRICLLLLEIVKAPEGASELVLIGCWMTIGVNVGGMPELMVPLIEEGLVEAAVAGLSPPLAQITWRTAKGNLAAAVCLLAWALSTMELPGINKTVLLLEKGFIDAAIAILKAFELLGSSDEANVGGIFHCLILLTALDLTAPEAKPIVEQLVSTQAIRRCGSD